MNDSPNQPSAFPGCLDSGNSVNIIDDGPGETNLPPCPPEILQKAQTDKERRKLYNEWLEQWKKQQQSKQEPEKGNDP